MQSKGNELITETNEPLNEPLSDNNESKTVISAQKPSDLTENQQRVYALIKGNTGFNSLNTRAISDNLNIAYSTAKRILLYLEKQEYVMRIGSKKTGYWIVKKIK